METKIKSASVKVMLSYDYSHFEASMSLENDIGLSMKEIDEARKNCQRLADKAVGQYKTAKAMAAKRSDGQFQMQNFEAECRKISQKDEHDRTLKEIAMLKEFEDEKWRLKFQYLYDYDDDEEYDNRW
jgi:hypothetical protein